MSDPDDDIYAALFAAGALTGPETAALKERLNRDPALAAKAREWELALSSLARRQARLSRRRAYSARLRRASTRARSSKR